MAHTTHIVKRLIADALLEDQVAVDLTTRLIPGDAQCKAVFLTKQPGILSGIYVAMEVFRQVDNRLDWTIFQEDGSSVVSGQTIAVVKGSLGSVLSAERTSLNFVQRMSGVATSTNEFVKLVEDLPAIIVDTRKTVPGWRFLDKYSVRMGGGKNHRFSLADGVLIKDNHIAAGAAAGLDIGALIAKARNESPHTVRIEIEAETLEQVEVALRSGADIVMLDNMDLGTMSQAVALCRGRSITEASGNVDLKTVRDIAKTGVDFISVGSITHSSRALDISLDVDVKDIS